VNLQGSCKKQEAVSLHNFSNTFIHVDHNPSTVMTVNPQFIVINCAKYKWRELYCIPKI